jgi:hypothetical protein
MLRTPFDPVLPKKSVAGLTERETLWARVETTAGVL